MNFIGPSPDGPRPQTNSQNIFRAGFFVAALFATGIVISATAEALATGVPLGGAISPGIVLVAIILLVCTNVMTLIHW